MTNKVFAHEQEVATLEAVPADGKTYVTFEKTALRFAPETPKDVWVETFLRLKDANRSIQWWVGDAFAFGEDAFGDDVFQYVDASEKTIANWASVCRKLPPARRRESLLFSHHAEVTKLEPDAQVRVLEVASSLPEGEATVRRIREMARSEEEGGRAEIAPHIPCPACKDCPRCGGTREILEIS